MRRAAIVTGIALGVLAGERAFAQAPDAGGKRIDSRIAGPADARSPAWTRSRIERTAPRSFPVVDPKAVEEAARKRRAGMPDARGAAAAEPSVDPVLRRTTRVSGNVRTRPLWWAGKIYYRGPDGKNSWCSAQFITKSVVLTAAHCVRDSVSGAFATNIVFLHQYDRGGYARRFAERCVATWNMWVSPTMDRWIWDYAMLLVDGDGGHFGTHRNWSGLYQESHSIGYPGKIQSGEVIQVNRGTLAEAVPGIYRMEHGNPEHTFGSSGGAWIGRFSDAQGDNNYVISVNSFGFPEREPGVTYGPYFDDDFKALLEFVQRGCRQ